MATLTTDNPSILVQITDTHLYGVPAGTLLKMNTQDTLDHVVKAVKQRIESIDLILATGDIAQDASESAYNHFINSISELDAPFRWIPGNHDSKKVMREVANDTDFGEKLVQLNNWLILFLDTSVEGQVHGMLDENELQFLDSELARAADSKSIDHCMICLHHNPTKGNAGWMKDIGLHNGSTFFDIITRYEKTNSVVYGHIHQELDYEHQGVRCLCTPSTCIQFKPHVTNFALDKLNPGYRTFKLYENGELESEVFRVTGYTFDADYNSPGY